MMIRKIFASIISLTTLILGGVVFAQTGNIDVMNLPKLDQYVTDFAGVLDATTLNEFNQHAYDYDQGSGRQFVAVLIPDRQGMELFDISLKIFNDNGIGSKKNNDGLLLVIATDEKKIRIMVGYGLEGEMPDVLASQIIENDIRPLVNAGDYAGAVRAFYTRSEEAIAGGEAKELTSSGVNISRQLFVINFIGFCIIVGIDIYFAIQEKKRKNAKKGLATIIDKIGAPKKKRKLQFPMALVFGFQFLFILSPWAQYITGPWIASWIGAIIFAMVTGPETVKGRSSSGFGGGFGGGGFSGGGGSSFSGGGGSSGGGGAGD